MKSIEIVGFKREKLGKKTSKDLRLAANVPCVLYGGQTVEHFSVPMFLFKNLVYTPEVCTVDLNIEGKKFKAILQDIQYHPVSEIILHADFLELNDNKEVKIDVPLKMVGTAPGVMKGGKLITKIRKVTIKALPKNLPDYVEIDISALELGKNIRINAIKAETFRVLNNPMSTVASVEIPRALKGEAAGK
jgi:large subunit ribosomal protein L25